MKSSTLGRAAALPAAAIVLTLGLASCASNEAGSSTASSSSAAGGASSAAGGSSSSSAAELSGTLNGAGSTAQQAAQQAWIAGITTSSPDLQVNYDAQGSGAGVTQFLSGAVSFAGSDVALTSAQLASAQTKCGAPALDVPDYISPIALAYNLQGVNGLQLSPETAAKIYSGAVTMWNDATIAADNPGVTLPATRITVVHRSDKSGTTNNFTDYLHKAAPDVWTNAAAEVWPISGGAAAQGTSGVVAALKATPGSIGYADESQVGTSLGSAKVKVGDSYVAPTSEAAAAAVDQGSTADGRPSGDLALSLNRTPTSSSAYPVVLVSYFIFCTKYPDAATAANVKGYATYITSAEGQQAAAKAAGSAPLSDTLRSKVQQSIAMIG